jgi:hypothetical protein
MLKPSKRLAVNYSISVNHIRCSYIIKFFLSVSSFEILRKSCTSCEKYRFIFFYLFSYIHVKTTSHFYSIKKIKLLFL